MVNVNFKELFGNFSAEDALAATETKKSSGFSANPDLYKPSIKDEKCKDMNYRSLVRFIPFFYEGKWRTTLMRWECYLKDVNGENGIFVISPKTENDKRKCPMRSLSYQLYKSDSAIDKENSKKINVYQQYYALVEVVKDVQHEEYNGRVMIYQFGQKINDKLEAAMKSTEFTDGFNPFALYNGKLFEINLTKGDQKMDNGRPVANYDACRFIDKTAPIHFGEGKTLEEDEASQRAFMEWLENGAPNIKNYLWKEWDAETTEKVNNILATYKSGYTAPRSTKASAKEAVDIVSQEKPATKNVEIPKVVEEYHIEDEPEEESISTDDDAWIEGILNS